MTHYYHEDLAYVHDSGFGDFAHHAAKMIIKSLNEQIGKKGLVIDLGCGSGIVAQYLIEDGFNVLGIDQSSDIINIAKTRAPKAEFIAGSFFDVDFPKSIGIISTSECFNYIFEEKDHADSLQNLFKKSYDALEEGGLFIFDMIEPDTLDDKKYIIEHDDWNMFVHSFENKEDHILIRDVTLFKKVGDFYRKSKEIHRAKLYDHERIALLLKSARFDVSLFKQYGELPLDEHHFGYLCKKKNATF